MKEVTKNTKSISMHFIVHNDVFVVHIICFKLCHVSCFFSDLRTIIHDHSKAQHISCAASGSGSTPTKDDQIAAARRLSLSSKELDLSGLGVTSVPPAAWETNDVMKLDLSKNSIEDLPNELSLCSSLQSLILSNNKIKRWPGTVFSSLASLSLLKLDNNPLAEILATDLEALSKLEVLDLSGSASSLPEPSAVSKLPHLKELYLRRMKLHGFPDSLLGLKLLRILDLSQNYLTSVPEVNTWFSI
jgi:hypothetical protein